MIPAYYRTHYARSIYNHLYKPGTRFHGFLGWTAIEELENAGNTVVYDSGTWLINAPGIPPRGLNYRRANGYTPSQAIQVQKENWLRLMRCGPSQRWGYDTSAADFGWYLRQEVPERPADHPRTHVVHVSDGPKLDAMLSGECHQLIRPLSDIRVGDVVLIDGWPSPSLTALRLRVTVSHLEVLAVDREGGFTLSRPTVGSTFSARWDSLLGDYLARLDHARPPKGVELRRHLARLYGPIDARTFHVIRWDPERNILEGSP